MKRISKILVIITIIMTSLVVLMLILSLFDLDVFGNNSLTSLLLTFASFAIFSFFSINSINIYNKKKIISCLSLFFLSLSLIFALIIFWANFKTSNIFNKITGIIAIATILFIIIIVNYLKLEKKYLYLQGITYSLIIILDIVLTLIILGVELMDNEMFVKIFISLCLLTFAFLCIISIVSRKSNLVDDEKYIKIKKQEYDELLEKIKILEEKNKEI